MRILKNTFFTLVIMFQTFIGSAQRELDSVVISASRIENTIEKSGRAITVVQASEFNQWPINTVEELLQYVSGVNINNRGGYGVQADIGIRGSTFSQVLVLIDNQRLNDPLTGHFNNYIPIPLAEIDRIEIIKGSVASSYGADAVGGVIHIKTKSYVGNELTGQSITSTSGIISYGDFGLVNLDAGLYQKYKKFGFSFGAKTMMSEGPTFENPNFGQPNVITDSLYNNFFDIRNFTTSLTYGDEKLRVHYRTSWDQRFFSAKYFYTSANLDESVEEVTNIFNQLNVKYLGKNGITDLGVSYRIGNDSFLFNPLFAANVHTTNRWNGTLMHTHQIKGFKVNVGSQIDYQDIISTDRGNHNLMNAGIFTTSSFQIRTLNVNAGFRMEYFNERAWYAVPQISLSLPYKQGHHHFSFGRAVRQPDFTEMYVSYLLNQPGEGRNIGNPDLLMEDAWNFDFGTKYNFSKNGYFSSSVFYRWGENLIDYSIVNSDMINNHPSLLPNTNYLYAQNIGESSTYGIEVDIVYKKPWSKDRSVEGRLAYTFLQTEGPNSVVSKYLSNHPLHQLSTGVDAKWGFFNIHLGYQMFVRNSERIQSIDAFVPYFYQLIHTRWSCAIPETKSHFFIDVRNVLNTQYQEILGARMPGRWWSMGVKFGV